MTSRKAKRMINEANDWLVFTAKEKDEDTIFSVYMQNEVSWEILLNLACSNYAVRETLRNVLKLADEHLANDGSEAES